MAMQTNILQLFFCVVSVNTLISNEIVNNSEVNGEEISDDIEGEPSNIFSGVYTECLLRMSYTCLQYKTLMYLKHLENMSDISVVGDYVRFVKLNGTSEEPVEETSSATSEELSLLIDRSVDKFFDNHVLKITALGKDITIPNTGEEFVGRKKRKGGGGGGHDHDDGGKKKMMMMAMMCMKMKFMMMVPAMMGMMGMMSFKGMMFSMMSFMVSKMMLIMKLLEKKGAIGGGGDAGWPAAAGGGGAWMPAGGQDYGGGGYDANGQWQSRSILEQSKLENEDNILQNKPISSYVTPILRYDRNLNNIKSYSIFKNSNNDATKAKQRGSKSRRKRGIVDMLQNAYAYWLGKLLGARTKKNNIYYPKYRIINGVKYIFYPLRQIQHTKAVKALNNLKNEEISKQTVTADFNKGEIVEGAIEVPVESRMNRKKFHKMKDLMNDTIEQSPWQ